MVEFNRNKAAQQLCGGLFLTILEPPFTHDGRVYIYTHVDAVNPELGIRGVYVNLCIEDERDSSEK
jgi:hypothetical protein